MPPSRHRTYRPEIHLLLLCARTQLATPSRDAIEGLLVAPFNWNFLLGLASRHSLIPLLNHHLSAIRSPRLPAQQLAKLKSFAQASAAKSLLLTAELVHVDALFRAANLNSLPYKGPVLAQQAYGSVALRPFDDLDVILPQRDLPPAHRILVDLGYQPKFSAALAVPAPNSRAAIPGEYKYHHPARDIIVELHTERTLRHFPKPPDLDALARSAVSVPLTPGHAVRTFAPEHAVPILCIHGSKDFWDRLSWIVDIVELFRAFPDLDSGASIRFAESLRAERMLHLGLLLVSNLLNAPLPAPFNRRIAQDAPAVALASAIEHRLLSEPSNEDFSLCSPLARLSYRRRMVAGLLAGWAYALRLALAPTVEEWQPASSEASALSIAAARPFRHLTKRRH